ncbi:uncharacterized protein LOC129572718 [Sitodiplosis mosellana]|uniref:uncharacterized protein LOC129572718 n=1 Tax=Sitodiplosis mosellana TaxID=263140 RepID=UPI002443DF5D|nr:uncharacterized protein LOC129572718 [Sitodiplosis mosellana]
MTEARLTRSGQRIYEYLMQGKRTRNEEGNVTSTGNFKSHYKKHPEKLLHLEQYLKQEDNNDNDNIDGNKSKQPRIADMLAPVSDEKIASKLVDFIVDGNLAFHISQLPSLRALLESASGRKVIMPSRRKFMASLQSKCDELKSTLKHTLKEQSFLCVTCDAWSSKGQSFLGVTIHFLNQHYKRESFLLAFKRMYARQTYLHLAQTLDEIFKDFEIDIEKITHIVTDGGSAFCKMFKEFGNTTDVIMQDSPEDEYDDDTNTAPTASSEQHETRTTSSSGNNEEESLDMVHEFMQTETGELFQNEILQFDVVQNVEPDDYFGGRLSNEQPQIKLPPQRRCFSHLLNLASQDFENMLPTMANRAFKQTYNKLHALWNTTNRSCYAKTICQNELGCSLKVPCETRWNSKFDAINKIVDICKSDTIYERNKINILIRRLKTELRSANHLLILEQSDISVMENYVKVMQPIASALDTLQGEYNCSQGLILPVIFSMKHKISSFDVDCNLLGDFKQTMLEVLVDYYYQ